MLNHRLQGSKRKDVLNDSLMVQLLFTHTEILAMSSSLVQIHVWLLAEQDDSVIDLTVHLSFPLLVEFSLEDRGVLTPQVGSSAAASARSAWTKAHKELARASKLQSNRISDTGASGGAELSEGIQIHIRKSDPREIFHHSQEKPLTLHQGCRAAKP